MTRFVWTFHRIEAKKAGAPRWLVTWGPNNESSITAARVEADLPLRTSDTMGALEGRGFAYYDGETLHLTREPMALRGRVF